MKVNEQKKTDLTDKEILQIDEKEDLSHHLLCRVYAKGLTFTNVSFEKSYFNECYFRNCVFINCNFTGARIKDSNFRGSKFTGCTLHYSTWDKTFVEEGILKNLSPWENVSRDFVRSLRVNFAQMGNQDAVNKAALAEMWLTKAHLAKVLSDEGYHFAKLEGKHGERALATWRYIWWWIVLLFWGHGEIIWVPIIWVPILPLLYAFCLSLSHLPFDLQFTMNAFSAGLGMLLGVQAQQGSMWTLMVFTVARTVLLGLFISTLFRKLSRR